MYIYIYIHTYIHIHIVPSLYISLRTPESRRTPDAKLKLWPRYADPGSRDAAGSGTAQRIIIYELANFSN